VFKLNENQNIAMLTDLLLLDIETVPQYENYNLLTDTWQNLWCEKISKTVPENFDEAETYHKRAGILAEFGKIIVSLRLCLQKMNTTTYR